MSSSTMSAPNGRSAGSAPAPAPFAPPHPLGDELALERLFRAHFAPLAGEAETRLGESAAASAPRVVETAFRQAWQERERLTTEPEALAFLHTAVQEAAGRELSRRAAAHHIRGQEAPAKAASGAPHAPPPAIDVEQAWAQLRRMLNPGQRGEAAGQAHGEVLRHEAAQHVAALARKGSWRGPLIVGAITVVVAAAAIWWIEKLGADGAVTKALAAADVRSYPAASGQFAIITLDDATKVTLAPTSRLIVPKRFGDEMRAVKIDGAATFVVSPGREVPFQVRVGNATVIATGTTITVSALADDAPVIVRLDEGSASVKVGKEQHPLTAGRALLVQPDGRVRAPTAAELNESMAWTERRIALEDRPLAEVVRQLNRLYGVDIKIADAELLERHATVRAPLDSLRAAIAQVEKSAGADFSYDGRTMAFTAKAGAGARR